MSVSLYPFILTTVFIAMTCYVAHVFAYLLLLMHIELFAHRAYMWHLGGMFVVDKSANAIMRCTVCLSVPLPTDHSFD